MSTNEINQDEIKWFDEQAAKIIANAEIIIKNDPEYKGPIIPYKTLNSWMEALFRVYMCNLTKLEVDQIENCFVGEDEIVSIAMSFWKDFDENIYMRIQQYLSDGRIVVYNPFEESNKDRIKSGELSSRSKYENLSNSIICFITLLGEMDEAEFNKCSEKIGYHTGAFRDMCVMVHEIAHMLDDNIRDKSDKLPEELDSGNMARSYLSETTAILFENIFGDYIIQNFPKYTEYVIQSNKIRLKISQSAIFKVGVISGVASVYLDKGDNRTEADYHRIIEYYVPDVKPIKGLLEQSPTMYPDVQYALATMLVPTLLKRYNADRMQGRKRVLDYLECIKKDDFEGALKCFDVDLRNVNSINELFQNLSEYMND